MTKKQVIITSYKGFDKDMKCLGFQFAVSKSYVHKGKVKACQSGFHACEYPLDVFNYYEPSSSIFATVQQSGQIAKHDDDSKVASSKIEIKAKVSIFDLVIASIKYTTDKCNKSNERHATGDRSASSATRYRSASSATGAQSASSATGDRSASSATGYQSASSATGEDAVAAAFGLDSRAMADEKGILVIAWYDGTRKRLTIGYVGEAGIKKNTWYKCDEKGALVEA